MTCDMLHGLAAGLMMAVSSGISGLAIMASASMFDWLAAMTAWILPWFFPFVLLISAFYYLIGIPIRRQERARLFLDLLAAGLKHGHSPEHTILSLSSSRDPMLGVRFHWLATHMQHGDRFIEALEKTPFYLPKNVVAMMRAGIVAGDLGKVIPACEPMLRDGLSQMRAAISYHMLLAFSFSPILLFALLISQRSQTALSEIVTSFGHSMPSLKMWEALCALWMLIYVGVTSLLFFQAVSHYGGQRFTRWYNDKYTKRMDDLCDVIIPWRRLRIHRDFTAILACLLDADVPEETSILIAADCVDNYRIRKNAQQAVAELQQGVKLPDVLKKFDDTGELHWRMSNACHASKGFYQALTGWHETLSARAFEKEQSASHRMTTLLLFLAGSVVLTTGLLVFYCLANIALMYVTK